MSNESNIFGQTPTSADSNGAPATPPNDHQNELADLLSSIKNERGETKYRDVKTALEALKHAQEYIPNLKTTNAEYEQRISSLQNEVERLKNIEKTVEELTKRQDQLSQKPTEAPVIDANVVAQLVTQTLSAKEQEKLANDNIKTVTSTMQEVFGEKASETFYSKATELGMDAATINALAAKSPTAVLQLFGIDAKSQQSHKPAGLPIQSSINTTNLRPPAQSFITRNDDPLMVGATTEDLKAERERSKQLVSELHNQGLTTADLTDPKVYFKHFGKK